MATATQEQIDKVKKISANLEGAFQALRQVAKNISMLLAAGRATCDEVKAYNLYALSLYNTQRGVLAKLRAAGEKDVPEVPPFPTLFAWKGVTGSDAWKIDCANQATSLSDALAAAIGPQTVTTQYLSSNDVRIITSDKYLYNPSEGVPSLADLTAKADQQGQLGAGILIPLLIAGIAVTLTAIGVVAYSMYMEESKIQEETSERTRIQAQAFEKFTAARASCYQECLATGQTADKCIGVCTKLVEKPNLKIDAARRIEGMGLLGTVGLVALAAGAGAGLYWWMRRKGPLPSGVDATD